MTITINPGKIMKFIRQHRTALTIAGILVIASQHSTIKSMDDFINSHGMREAYDRHS